MLSSIFLVYGFQLLTLAFAVVLNVVLARVLFPTGFGLYQLAALLPTILGMLLTLGVPAANVYFVGRGDASISSAFRYTLGVWAGSSAFGSIASLGLIAFLGDWLLPGVPPFVAAAAVLLLPLILLRSLLSSLLHAQRDFFRLGLSSTLPPAVAVASNAVLTWRLDLGVPGALGALALGELAALIVVGRGIHAHWRKMPESVSMPEGRLRRILAYGWKSHLGNVVQFLNYRADIFLVNFFLGAASTGHYVVAVVIAERLGMVSQAVAQVMFPRLVELHRDEQLRKRLTPLVCRWVVLVSVAFSLLIAALSGPIIRLLFGEAYRATQPALLWLLPGLVAIAGGRILGNDVAARGRPDLNLHASLVGLVLNLTGNAVLIPVWGVVGAAVSSTISYITITAIVAAVYASMSGNKWWEPFWVRASDIRLLKNQIVTDFHLARREAAAK